MVKVAILMGSKSDFDVVKPAVNVLKKFGVENEVLCYENSGHALDKDPEVAKQSRDIITAYAERYL
jgi:phosphoribosylcarboxyaminoimidazole (NCAIR) mutase